MACAWHRQVRLLGIVVRLLPHHKPSRFALGRRSQAHATKKTTRTKRKTKPKARRRGAVPANPFGDRLPLFRRARFACSHKVCRNAGGSILPVSLGRGKAPKGIVPRHIRFVSGSMPDRNNTNQVRRRRTACTSEQEIFG